MVVHTFSPRLSSRARQADKQEAKKKLFLDFQVQWNTLCHHIPTISFDKCHNCLLYLFRELNKKNYSSTSNIFFLGFVSTWSFSPEFTPFSQIQCIALLAALNSGSDWIERDKTVMMDPLGAKSHFWQPWTLSEDKKLCLVLFVSMRSVNTHKQQQISTKGTW